jgi:hypothetical protein
VFLLRGDRIPDKGAKPDECPVVRDVDRPTTASQRLPNLGTGQPHQPQFHDVALVGGQLRE